jgi:hypothetical protein
MSPRGLALSAELHEQVQKFGAPGTGQEHLFILPTAFAAHQLRVPERNDWPFYSLFRVGAGRQSYDFAGFRDGGGKCKNINPICTK